MNDEHPTHQPSIASSAAPSEGATVVNGMESSEKRVNPVLEEHNAGRISEIVSEPEDPAHEHDEGSDANEDEEGGIS